MRLALSGVCGRGGGKKKGGSQGTQGGKAQRRLPLTPDSFCDTQTSKAGRVFNQKQCPEGLPLAPQSARGNRQRPAGPTLKDGWVSSHSGGLLEVRGFILSALSALERPA